MHVFDFGPLICLKSSDKRMWYTTCWQLFARDLQAPENIGIAHAVICFDLGRNVFKWI